MGKGYSPSGSYAGVGEAADVALIPSVHPGLRFPDGDPPGAPHVLRQLAHGDAEARRTSACGRSAALWGFGARQRRRSPT